MKKIKGTELHIRNFNKCVPSGFVDCLYDLLYDNNVRDMEKYRQHCDTDCFEHCLNVAYYTYIICKALNCDYKSAARGAMLHDMFLYDWRTTKLDDGKHAFRHPSIALDNARNCFQLNKVEEDCIKKHMWPLTIIPPVCPEAFIVSLLDKYCASVEILEYYFIHKSV